MNRILHSELLIRPDPEAWFSCDVYRKGGKRGGEEEEEEEEEAAAGSWRNQAASNTIMIRGLPSGVTEEQVPVPYILTGVADPWHFGVDPDPRIHASD